MGLHEIFSIEDGLKELERTSEEYESFLELEGLREQLELTEKAIERQIFASKVLKFR